MTWTPLVDRADARSRVRAIAEQMTSVSADHALARFYLAQEDVVPDPDAVASTLLTRAINALADGVPGAGFADTAAGIGWTVQHLAGGELGEAVCAKIDAALVDELPRFARYDLVYGVVGVGVYALERPDRLATRVLDELERRSDSVAWFTPTEALLPLSRAESLDGRYEIGMAHGVAGIIGLLARYVVCEIEVARARILLEAATSWLLARERPDPAGRFPGSYHADGRASGRRERVAWCDGDLGIAFAVLAASIACNRDNWRQQAIELATACARREPAMRESYLYDGTFGAAHLFNRLFHATGDALFADAARRWCDRGLAMSLPTSDGLTSGKAGIALALHALTTSVEPSWDRLLLVDL